MAQVTITGHTVTLLAVANGQLQALDAEVQKLTAQRRALSGAYHAELKRVVAEQGQELPDRNVRVEFAGNEIRLSWEEAPEEDGSPPARG